MNKRTEKHTDTTGQHVDISENFVFETKSTYTFPSVMSKISVSVPFFKTNTLYLDLLTLLKTFNKNRNSVTEFQFFRNASDISSNGGVFHEKKDSSLIYASDLETPNAELPTQSKIVICGGGAQGAAIAYKLALKGIYWMDPFLNPTNMNISDSFFTKYIFDVIQVWDPMLF